MEYLIVLPIAYLMGSMPTGLVLIKLWRKIDIRQYGSGNIGATNVLRTAGAGPAILVLVMDAGKGALAVLLARLLLDTPTAEAAAGVAVIMGHNWSIFIRFHGGRGMAPALGSVATMTPLALVAGVAIFIPTALISRYVSLASLTAIVVTSAALGSGVLANHYPSSYLWYVIVAGSILIVQHIGNIKRLLNGTENRLGQPSRRRSGSDSVEDHQDKG